jgi:fatty-acyl-CoA synthase
MTAPDLRPAERFYRVRQLVVVMAVTLAALSPLAVAIGAAGARLHLLSLQFGFGWMAMRVAPVPAVAGLVLGGLGLIAAATPPRRGAIASLMAIVLAGASLTVIAQWRSTLAQAPPVHDVSTDWTRTQLFSDKLMLARGLQANPIETNPIVPRDPAYGALAGRYVGVVNARTCPAATPIILAAAPAQAYGQAKAAVLRSRLRLVTDDPAHGLIEATQTSPLFGFEDDLALSLHPVGAGARIDMRASARMGQSDYGRDCELVTRLRAALVGGTSGSSRRE